MIQRRRENRRERIHGLSGRIPERGQIRTQGHEQGRVRVGVESFEPAMPLSPDHKFGPYTLISPLGEGGMGEVWKARDTRLDRTVALKVAKADFGERFEREARAVAALNHPHICTLHDVGSNYLVMEFVDGPTLAERISAGAIPMEE